MNADIAWNYGTSVWQQRLVFVGPGWRLERRIQGDLSRGVARAQRLADGVSRIENDGAVRLVRPTCTEDGAVYDLTTCEVLSGQLWPGLRLVGRPLESVMTGLGAALARLHTSVTPMHDVVDATSPHLRRLRAHLDADGSTWAGQVVAQQSATLIAQLRCWLDELPTTGVLCHGGFALGSVFIDQDVQRIEVLTGEELMVSIPELDLGWMLGELTEHEFQAGMRGGNGLAYEGAAQWLLEGWSSVTGTSPDRAWLDKVIALRSFLRMCDVAETTHSTDAAARDGLFLSYLVERVRRHDEVSARSHVAVA